MTKIQSTPPPRPRKPITADKLPKDFPLFRHASGQYAKKVKGKLWYFGVDPQTALDRWNAEKADLLKGKLPRSRRGLAPSSGDGSTLRDLVNNFLNAKRVMVETGERSPHTLESYRVVCDELVSAFGRERLLANIGIEDWRALRTKWAKRWGVVRLGAEINRAKVVFTWGYKNRVIREPMFYGDAFDKPEKKALNPNRAAQGMKMFEPHELRRMIDAASQPLKTMLLLGANGALGNNDVGLLPIKPSKPTAPLIIDLDGGWLNYPRPKTGIMRRIPLWLETVAAMREWFAMRPTPATEADANLFFLTCRGHGWTKGLKNRSITNETRELLNRLKIDGKRNFYALRHGFGIVGAESLDQIAVDSIMGHADGSVGEKYREKLPSDERLRKVTDFVRAWLFNLDADEVEFQHRASAS